MGHVPEIKIDWSIDFADWFSVARDWDTLLTPFLKLWIGPGCCIQCSNKATLSCRDKEVSPALCWLREKPECLSVTVDYLRWRRRQFTGAGGAKFFWSSIDSSRRNWWNSDSVLRDTSHMLSAANSLQEVATDPHPDHQFTHSRRLETSFMVLSGFSKAVTSRSSGSTKMRDWKMECWKIHPPFTFHCN